MNKIKFRLAVFLSILFIGSPVFAVDKVYPPKPNPPRLVNDYAHMLKDGEAEQLERKLEDFVATTSNRITIVTISDLGGNDISEYSVHIFNDWGLGEQGKNNGVLLLVALNDGYGKRKAWITVGKGLQGVLTDAKSGQIFRNELKPAFVSGDYYKGFSDATDAIIAVTKDEYKGEGRIARSSRGGGRTALIIVVIIIVLILKITRRGGGNNRGGGLGNLATGMLLGNMLGGGFGGRGGGDSGGGFGGFGGFGGGSTDGGGAGGSW